MGNIEKQEIAPRAVSVAPSRQALVRAGASLSIRHFSGLLSVCATPRVRVMGNSPTFNGALWSGVIPTVRGASRESAKGAHALTVNVRYGYRFTGIIHSR